MADAPCQRFAPASGLGHPRQAVGAALRGSDTGHPPGPTNRPLSDLRDLDLMLRLETSLLLVESLRKRRSLKLSTCLGLRLQYPAPLFETTARSMPGAETISSVVW
ncbi:MAG: hypothetical protein EA400_10750 [Chromatiaceae bacterium]|nr:MAG: hypothetical protein EA400_10750 [Chromatiaceae bacterium]